MRSLTLSITLLAAGLSTANAQQFLLQAGSGATLVGDTFFVQPGQNFTVRTILDMQGTTAQINVISTAIAYSISGGSTNKLSFVSGILDPSIVSNFGAGFTNPTFIDRNASTLNPGNYSAAAGQLPRVIYNARGNVSGNAVLLRDTLPISEITFSNSLSAGEVYGDSSTETGLFLAHQVQNGASPNLGASGYTGRRFGSPKYKVQAVPEPATLTVALAGLALMRARRKRTVTN